MKAEEERCRHTLHQVHTGLSFSAVAGLRRRAPPPGAALKPAFSGLKSVPIPSCFFSLLTWPFKPCSCPQVVHNLPDSKRASLDIHRHVLPAAGGASGANRYRADWGRFTCPQLLLSGAACLLVCRCPTALCRTLLSALPIALPTISNPRSPHTPALLPPKQPQAWASR